MSVKDRSNDYATFGKPEDKKQHNGKGPNSMERSSSLDSIQTTSALVAVPEGTLESNGAQPPKTR